MSTKTQSCQHMSNPMEIPHNNRACLIAVARVCAGPTGLTLGRHCGLRTTAYPAACVYRHQARYTHHPYTPPCRWDGGMAKGYQTSRPEIGLARGRSLGLGKPRMPGLYNTRQGSRIFADCLAHMYQGRVNVDRSAITFLVKKDSANPTVPFRCCCNLAIEPLLGRGSGQQSSGCSRWAINTCLAVKKGQSMTVGNY